MLQDEEYAVRMAIKLVRKYENKLARRETRRGMAAISKGSCVICMGLARVCVRGC